MQHKISRRSFILGGSLFMLCAGINSVSCNKSNLSSSKSTIDYPDINVAFSTSCTNVDPLQDLNVFNICLSEHIFESLYDYDFNSGEFYNSLALEEPVKVDDYTYDKDKIYYKRI